ncbi:MAG: hypothetical protein IJ386_05450 [Clostridia bacterium]|nr:hypothetical protein [Clostridia bacterium]
MKSGSTAVSDIIVHASELENRCEYEPAVSVFLTPAEQEELWRTVRYPHRLFFWGGFSDAERRAAVFLPEWAADGAPPEEQLRRSSPAREAYLKELIFGEDAPFEELSTKIALIRISGSGHRTLAHKDILGSIMALGITRQSLGDICMISDHEAVAVLSGKLTDYVAEELTKAGADGVKVSLHPDPANFYYERQFEEVCTTVASLRLDGIVSALTGMSRTKAAEHITAGLVQLSGTLCDEVARDVSVGDTLTVRGYGKYLLSSTDGLTRKSRLRITAKKYI